MGISNLLNFKNLLKYFYEDNEHTHDKFRFWISLKLPEIVFAKKWFVITAQNDPSLSGRNPSKR